MIHNITIQAIVVSLVAGLHPVLQDGDTGNLAERLKSPKDNEKVSALYDAAQKFGSVAALRLITPFFTHANAYVSDRAISAFSQAKDGAAFTTVVKEQLARPEPKVHRAVLEALMRTRHAVEASLVEPFLKEKDEELLSLAIEVLLEHPPGVAPKDLRSLASESQKIGRVRANALFALARIDKSAAAAALGRASESKDVHVRVGALLARREMGLGISHAAAALSDSSRRVRLAALDWIYDAREAATIPNLIELLGKDAGRVKIEAERALKHISLRDFGPDPSAWKNWYEQVGPSFVPPPIPGKEAAPGGSGAGKGKNKKTNDPPPPPGPSDTRADGPRYYDFIVKSDQVAFVVDVSGSMRTKYTMPGATAAGAGGEKTRLEHAADALRDVILALPKGTRISVIIFNSEPIRFRRGSKNASARAIESSPEVAAEVHKFLLSIGASQTTNISDALELVLDDMEVDTVYLLTDGAPSAGKRNLPSRIIDWAKRVTRLSRTEINTIGFSPKDRDADFLRDIAGATGGKFDSK